MVTHADLDTFSRASLALYAPDLAPETYAKRGTEFLRELVPADMYCVGDLDTKAGTLAVDFSTQDAALPRVMEGFGRTMAKYPLFNWDPAVNGGRPFFRQDFFSVREFRELDIYSECFSLLEWTNHGAVHVPTGDEHTIFIGLERSGTVDYTERDRVLLELAQTHLANARKLANARAVTRGTERLDPREFGRAGFSPRESEVLVWLTEGKTNAEMAALMGVALQTVKFHLTSIFNKIGTGNRLAATLHALDLAQRLRRGGSLNTMKVNVRR